MATNMRKELVWSIKKGLLRLSADQIFKVATDLTPLPQRDPVKLDKQDEEECFDYICSYISAEALFELEDEGLSLLLCMKDAIDEMIVSSSHHVDTAEEEVEVLVHRTQPNVTAKLTVNADTGYCYRHQHIALRCHI